MDDLEAAVRAAVDKPIDPSLYMPREFQWPKWQDYTWKLPKWSEEVNKFWYWHNQDVYWQPTPGKLPIRFGKVVAEFEPNLYEVEAVDGLHLVRVEDLRKVNKYRPWMYTEHFV